MNLTWFHVGHRDLGNAQKFPRNTEITSLLLAFLFLVMRKERNDSALGYALLASACSDFDQI